MGTFTRETHRQVNNSYSVWIFDRYQQQHVFLTGNISKKFPFSQRDPLLSPRSDIIIIIIIQVRII